MNLLFTSRLYLVSHEMIHKRANLWRWVNSEKLQRFWLAIALKKSTDMSVIGYIAQCRKNTLDSLPDL